MKLTNREKVILPLALFIIAAACFINFIYLPLNKDIKSLQKESEELETQIQDSESKQKAIEELQEQITLSKEEYDTKNSDVMPIWDQSELLFFVESTTDSLCVKKSINFFDVISADVIQAGDINIEIITSYDNLKKIWGKLDNAKYYNTVTRFSMKELEAYETDADSEQKLEVSMNIRFYSHNLLNDYPDHYEFLSGDFGKEDIFK